MHEAIFIIFFSLAVIGLVVVFGVLVVTMVVVVVVLVVVAVLVLIAVMVVIAAVVLVVERVLKYERSADSSLDIISVDVVSLMTVEVEVAGSVVVVTVTNRSAPQACPCTCLGRSGEAGCVAASGWRNIPE